MLSSRAGFEGVQGLIMKFTYNHLAHLKLILPDGIVIEEIVVSRMPRIKLDLRDAHIPLPVVLIDKESDSDATIVQVSFDCCLGALFETMKILNDLGFDVAKRTITAEGSVVETKFYVTQLSNRRKIEDPDLLKYIRLAILNNLMKYHPYVEKSRSRLAMGKACGIQAPVY
ncbi:ACT domain-containing protein ACR12-like protein [Tanacetum coccineum]